MNYIKYVTVEKMIAKSKNQYEKMVTWNSLKVK